MTTTYTKPTVGASDDIWGTTLNTTIDAIAADMDERPVLLSSGSTALADTTIVLDINYRGCRLELDNITAGASQAFIRFTVGSVQTSGYEYVRTDVSNKSSGTQTLAGSASAGAIFLTDTLKSLSANAADAGRLTLDFYQRGSSPYGMCCDWRASYKNNDGSGYRTVSTGAGSLPGMSAIPTALVLGGFSSLYTDGLRCNWAIFGLPGVS